ncbi:MAG: hypothetical protein WA609_09810 [Terriglobales bacterium]
MKKSLLVITLLVFGCSMAFAQSGTYSFWDAAGTLEYCNFNVITTNSGGVVAGFDNTTTGCGLEYNSPIVGFSATTPNDGLPAHGKGAVVGDGIYDASCVCFTGEQWTVWQSAKASKRSSKTGYFSGKYGWLGVAGAYTGYYFGDNYGYLGSGYPAGNVASHGTTAGKGQSRIAKK